MADLATADKPLTGRDETAWLIERGQPENQDPTVWWVRNDEWTTDANKAERFFSRDAAQTAIESRSGVVPRQRFIGRPTQHVFLRAADKPLTGRDELREWTPELLAAARERIHGSTNVSRAFAEHLLNQLEAALRAADKPLTGREHTHPTRQTPGYERADIPTWPDCPACAATSTAPALDALITARHAFERHPGPADHPRCRQWAEEVLEVVALSVPTAPALDVAVDTILAWAKDYYGTTNMPAGGMFAEAVRVSRLSPTTDTPVSARVTPKPHYASQAEFGAALEDERDEEPERYSYEEGRS